MLNEIKSSVFPTYFLPKYYFHLKKLKFGESKVCEEEIFHKLAGSGLKRHAPVPQFLLSERRGEGEKRRQGEGSDSRHWDFFFN